MTVRRPYKPTTGLEPATIRLQGGRATIALCRQDARLSGLSAGVDLHHTVRKAHYRHDVISSMLLRNYRLIRGFEPLPHE